MARQLTIDEMLEAAQGCDLPLCDTFIMRAESLAQDLAVALAAHLDIAVDLNGATFQPGCGGTCAPFYAMRSGQTLPECMTHLDEGGEWNTYKEEQESMAALVAKGRKE